MAEPAAASDGVSRRLLTPSELGTKEYWDQAYSRELHNHQEDADDEGTVWFSESGAEEAMLAQLNALNEDGLLCRHESRETDDAKSGPASRFLDLGTGNGHLLFALREEDDDGNSWGGEMIGVDYSETSIQLAKQIAAQKDAEHIDFEQWDLLAEPPGPWLKDGFDVALDKGTFDAISLMSSSAEARHPCETYREKVVPLIKPGGFLCITSCNWTKGELLDWLAPGAGALVFHSEAKYPTFTFGGQTGQSIVTLVFRKAEA
ncbi:S-adenosyl-L-methionine-dependent methyltransferase [Teratosphaeria nubilosa]|uniref:Protein-lysine N-methyltransferase EFM4 n=1 Tax=Teratosphaeria nubilosa TaxID=161662 RepID=A0A6G1KTF0_9PEZI|nr:S-adenosyl-L-methionine-dependent methyltransferase [Teratosphaeria nubilosa]